MLAASTALLLLSVQSLSGSHSKTLQNLLTGQAVGPLVKPSAH